MRMLTAADLRTDHGLSLVPEESLRLVNQDASARSHRLTDEFWPQKGFHKRLHSTTLLASQVRRTDSHTLDRDAHTAVLSSD